MLSVIINTFNGIAAACRMLYCASYQTGKFIALCLSAIFSGIFQGIASISYGLSVIYEDFHLFMDEINLYVVKMLTSVHETCSEIVEKFSTVFQLIGDEYFRFIATGKIQIHNLVNAFSIGGHCLIHNLYGALCIIGNLMWFVVTLLPNTIYYALVFMKYALNWILDLICAIFMHIYKSLFDMKTNMVKTAVNTPRQTISGLVILILLAIYYRLTMQLLRKCLSYARRIYQRIGIYIHRNIYRRITDYQTERAMRAIERELHSLRHEDQLSSEPNLELSTDADPNNCCIICRDRKKTVVFFPCRHLCACRPCSAALMSYQKKCPICRTSIKQKCAVFT